MAYKADAVDLGAESVFNVVCGCDRLVRPPAVLTEGAGDAVRKHDNNGFSAVVFGIFISCTDNALNHLHAEMQRRAAHCVERILGGLEISKLSGNGNVLKNVAVMILRPILADIGLPGQQVTVVAVVAVLLSAHENLGIGVVMILNLTVVRAGEADQRDPVIGLFGRLAVYQVDKLVHSGFDGGKVARFNGDGAVAVLTVPDERRIGGLGNILHVAHGAGLVDKKHVVDGLR